VDLPATPFPAPLLLAAQLLAWGLVLHALLRADWRRFRDPESLHIYLATTTGVMVLWQIQARLSSGLHVHLLGATLLTLMFGWRFAVIALALVTGLEAVNGHMQGAGLGLNLLLDGIVPISSSWLCAWLVVRRLPHNFFVYIFAACFGGAALAIAGSGLAGGLLLMLSDAAPQLQRAHLSTTLLLMFPEAFVTGMLLTLFTVYAPQWVTTFRDELYLHGR